MQFYYVINFFLGILCHRLYAGVRFTNSLAVTLFSILINLAARGYTLSLKITPISISSLLDLYFSSASASFLIAESFLIADGFYYGITQAKVIEIH